MRWVALRVVDYGTSCALPGWRAPRTKTSRRYHNAAGAADPGLLARGKGRKIQSARLKIRVRLFLSTVVRFDF